MKEYTPYPKEIELKQSKLHGFGIFATEAVAEGHDFGITHILDSRFPNGYSRTPLGAFINHSDTPNCEMYEIKNTWYMRTRKNIEIGDELTVDYRPWYDEKTLASYSR